MYARPQPHVLMTLHMPIYDAKVQVEILGIVTIFHFRRTLGASCPTVAYLHGNPSAQIPNLKLPQRPVEALSIEGTCRFGEFVRTGIERVLLRKSL